MARSASEPEGGAGAGVEAVGLLFAFDHRTDPLRTQKRTSPTAMPAARPRDRRFARAAKCTRDVLAV